MESKMLKKLIFIFILISINTGVFAASAVAGSASNSNYSDISQFKPEGSRGFVFDPSSNIVIAASTFPWPVSNPTFYNISGFKSGGTSGIVFDPSFNRLFAVDDGGRIADMTFNGFVIRVKKIKSASVKAQNQETKGLFGGGEDVEAIATTGATYLYAGLERKKANYYDYRDRQWHNQKVAQIWQIATTSILTTGKEWLLDMPTSSGSGLEGLTWVPNGDHVYGPRSSGGVFFASSQSNGTIYVYDINISGTSTIKPKKLEKHIASFKPTLPAISFAAKNDISDLYFDPSQKLLYVLYDSANLLVLIDTSSANYNVLKTYRLLPSSSGKSDEGITVLPSCGSSSTTTLYLANDKNTSNKIEAYHNFPVSCGGGVANDSQFISQTVPTFMQGGESYWVTLAFKNTGTSTWQSGSYAIGEQPLNNTFFTWGVSTVNLNGTIGPNKVGYFSFQIVAPLQSGSYRFQWRMKDGQDWFGEKSTAINLEVFGTCNGQFCIPDF
jgi:uncharacterized protein YjiK